MKLVEAQEGRRILDRLVGWETSPVLWRVFGRGQAASAGRVQSVAVRLVVERERARMAFRAGQWSDLEAELFAHDQALPGLARRARRPSRRRRSRLRRRDREARAPRIQRARRRCRAARRGRGRRRSPTGLRDVAVRGRVGGGRAVHRAAARRRSRRRRCSRSRAASSASARPARCRSPSASTSADTSPTCEPTARTCRSRRSPRPARAIREQYGEEYLPAEPRAYRSKVKNAQEAHEAIRPAGDRIRSPDEVRVRARRRRAAPLRAGLDPHGRVPDVRRARQQDDASRRRDLDRERDARRSAPRARRTTSSAGAACTSKTSTRARSSRTKRASRRSSKARRVACTDLVAGRARDQAARALHRGEPRQGARGARHRSAVHLRGGDRDDPGAQLRVAQGHRARARVDRVRGHEPARAALRPSRRLRLHRDDGRSARRDRARRGRSREVAAHLLLRERQPGLRELVVARAARQRSIRAA